MTHPTLHRAYTVVDAGGHKFTRTPEAILTRFGGEPWVQYTIGRGEVRCCTLRAWSRWAERAR